MKIEPIKIYHKFPYPLRIILASLKGYGLRRWRYGPETDRLVKETIEREKWGKDKWETWQAERLSYILYRAAKKVPYYRDYWLNRRMHGDSSSWEKLDNWPVLNKEEVRRNPKAFLADDCRVRNMYHEHTSGTTGKPLTLWWSRRTVREFYALFEARVRIWNGVTRNDRWAILGGRLVSPNNQKYPPFWIWNAGLKQLYLSSYHISSSSAKCYIDEISRCRVVYLVGNTSPMYWLAKFVLDEGISTPQLKIAISSGEPIYQYQREVISKAFKCRVCETYGMAEVVYAASECRYGKMHAWPETGIMEVFSNNSDRRIANGQSGRFICTSLLNMDMPLIRYELGDYGALTETTGICACGRNIPILKKIEGRTIDTIITREGKRLGHLDPIFKSDTNIKEAQIIQERIDYIRIRFVPDKNYMPRDGALIIQRLKDRVGNVKVLLEPVDSIPRSANGKFKAVISKVNNEST